MTTNEAAERFRRNWRPAEGWNEVVTVEGDSLEFDQSLDEALAAAKAEGYEQARQDRAASYEDHVRGLRASLAAAESQARRAQERDTQREVLDAERLEAAMHAAGEELGADSATPQLYPSDARLIAKHYRAALKE